MVAKSQRPSVFHQGLEVQGWILDKLLDNNDEAEQWLAHHKETQTEKIIKFIHPQEQFATGDFDLENKKITIEVVTESCFHAGDVIDGWTLIERIGTGNTAEVWQVEHRDAHETPVVLKICRTQNPDQIELFNFEHKVFKKIHGMTGVIPLLDCKIKSKSTAQDPSWYAMPLVIPIIKYFDTETRLVDIVDVVLRAAEVILALAAKDILYTDLKIEHFSWYNEGVVLIDFASVSYPGSKYRDENYIINEFPAHVARALAKLLGYCQQKIQRFNPTLDKIIKIYSHAPKQESVALQKLIEDLTTWRNQQTLTAKEAQPILLQEAIRAYQRHDYVSAEENCQQLLSQEPDQPDAHHLLGVVALLQGDYVTAKESIEQAIEICPNEPAYYNSLGQYYEAKNKIIQAISCYRRALKLKPDYQVAYMNNMMAQVQRNEKAKYRQSQRIAAKLESTLLSKQGYYINEQETQKLLSALRTKVEIIGEFEKKLLAKSPGVELSQVTSSATVSWDQYFQDLSMGSYRTCYNLDRRPFRSRAWHYLFKNLNIVDHILQRDVAEVHLLDIGCSSGYLRRFFEGNISIHDQRKIFYWGIDVREDMLHRAVYNVKDLESGAPGHFMPSMFLMHDVQKGMPFNDAQFDDVVCFEFIKYMPLDQARQLLKEVHRIMKPHSQLYISTTHTPNREGFVGSLNFNAFEKLLMEQGFQVQAQYGSQAEWSAIEPKLRRQHRGLVDDIKNYMPTEILAAILCPLYPEVATQRVYHCVRG